ncbi:MAG: glycosyltransferase WbuB [Elusimicrobia bacterium HGW-Elusimicrobia-3]|nr:MAG: glycosyltransferase WbuB [Elusimicrobia bacterium HGW-Elusimicrobia-3]
MPEKLKVLIVTERFYPEEFIVNDLAAEWAAGGMAVDVLTQAPSYPAGRLFAGYSNAFFSSDNWKGINIFRFFTVTGYRDSLLLKLLNYLNFAFTGTLAALVKARGYDRIFVYQTGPLTLAIPAVIAGRIYGIPVTIWTQDIWPDMVYSYGFKRTRLLDWFLGLIIRFVYANCSEILVSCEGFARRIEEYVPGRQIKHFPNWPTVVPDGGVERMPLPAGFNFTFAGNVGKLQNLENILRGFALAVAKQPELRLNIVGDGSHLETLKTMAKEGSIPGVTFWGRHASHQMPAFFRASDVMIVSLSNTPGLNLVVPAKFQAYLAFHKPVFAVINGEVKDLVGKHCIGLSADPDSPEAIRDGFLEFYFSNQGGTNNFAANARRLLETEYDRALIIAGMRARVAAAK